jgi:CelD/BcsL family acetyltransferase involved in cellulose biosynthesis
MSSTTATATARTTGGGTTTTRSGVGIRVSVTTGGAAVAELARRGWDELLLSTPGSDPLRLTGVLALTAAAGSRVRATPTTVTIERDGSLVAAAALAVGRERGLRTVRHLGEPSGWLAPEPCAADDRAREALADALSTLRGDLLVLTDLPADGHLVRALRERHPGMDVIPEATSWVADPARDTPSMARRRKEAARIVRRAAEGGQPLDVRVHSDWWGEIDPIAEELLDFQARCREGREMDPLTATAEGRALARGMLAVVGERDAVRVATVRGGPGLLSFHLAIVSGDHAVGFKTAARRDVPGLSGVGWCSMLALHDRLAEEGVRRVDMAPGGDRYKASIATPLPLVTVRVGLSPAGRGYLAAVRRVRRLRAAGDGAALAAGAWAAALAPAVQAV